MLRAFAGSCAVRPGPSSAVGALAGADDCDSLLAKRVVVEGSRDPVESVLERAGDGAVVFRCREENRVGSRYLGFDQRDRGRLDRQVFVVGRKRIEMVPEDELDLGAALRRGRVEKSAVVRARRRLPLIASRRISGSS